ncbi:pimeloyl-ACP methyl ester carboxylesterase [Streptomyces sp. V4I8]|uniref:alpha/beta fold hydrolase n=1 Tax=Streptomyces sp. V4I8 TaxID=3156469 RepID=UPI003514D561
MDHLIDLGTPPGIRLWAQDHGAADAPPLLLIMGAQASGLGWPDELVALLAAQHRVIRYDHRDTGRSTWAYDEQPYPLTTLADDALAVLDGLDVPRAHVVGMSLGGMLTQLLIADHPDRLLSATLIGTSALSDTPYLHPDGTRTPAEELPGIDPRIMELWSQPWTDEGREAELERRVTHWRLLSGGHSPFDADYFRTLDRKVIAHTGHHRPGDAHGRADYSGMLRTGPLARTTVPTLVISAPAEPVFPLPHAHHLAQTINGAHVVEIPGMGHALPPEIHKPLATAILDHTAHH